MPEIPGDEGDNDRLPSQKRVSEGQNQNRKTQGSE
tara:strand:+ start:731 stop:835 length:105 start_codon:yes stop_codon:yes gene_type:complete